MKTRRLAPFVTSAMIAACIAASPASAQDSAATGRSEASLAGGTAIYADLNSSIDSKKAKSGDAVMAHTTEALKSADDRTILPKGTKIVGHITQASARSKGAGESTVSIEFDKAILKDGGEMPLNLVIQALAAPVSFSAPPDLGTPSSTGTTRTSPMSGAHGGPPSASAPQSGVGSGNGPELGANSSDTLGPNSRGVYGLNGLKLGTAPANNNGQVSIVTSDGKNVHLDSGTRLLLVTQSPSS
jgi:hypothetical protein